MTDVVEAGKAKSVRRETFAVSSLTGLISI
jgi:hypothetical protein